VVANVLKAVSIQVRFRDSQHDDLVPWESPAVVLSMWKGVGRVPKATVVPGAEGGHVDVTVPLGNSSPLNFSGAFSKSRGPRRFILEIACDVASERVEFSAEKMPDVKKNKPKGANVPRPLAPPVVHRHRLQAAALPAPLLAGGMSSLPPIVAAAVATGTHSLPELGSPLGLTPLLASSATLTRAASKRPRVEPIDAEMARMEALAHAASSAALSPLLSLSPGRMGSGSSLWGAAGAARSGSGGSGGSGSGGMPAALTREPVPRGKGGAFELFADMRTPELGITPILRAMERSDGGKKRKAADDVDTALSPMMLTQWIKEVDRALETCARNDKSSLEALMSLIMQRPDMLNQAQFAFDVESGQGKDTLLYRCDLFTRLAWL
jgi:hypothetical protein